MDGSDFVIGIVLLIVIGYVVYFLAVSMIVITIIVIAAPGAAAYFGVLGWVHVQNRKGNAISEENAEKRASAAAILTSGVVIIALIISLISSGFDEALITVWAIGSVELAILVVLIVACTPLALLAGPGFLGYVLGSGLIYYLESLFGSNPKETVLPIVGFRASKGGHAMGIFSGTVFLVRIAVFLTKGIVGINTENTTFWSNVGGMALLLLLTCGPTYILARMLSRHLQEPPADMASRYNAMVRKLLTETGKSLWGSGNFEIETAEHDWNYEWRIHRLSNSGTKRSNEGAVRLSFSSTLCGTLTPSFFAVERRDSMASSTISKKISLSEEALRAALQGESGLRLRQYWYS